MKLTRGKKKLEIYGSQRGVATLLISVSIALLMAVAAVGMMRSGMLEQRIVANEMRSREAQELAQAGWDYVMASGSVPAELCLGSSIEEQKYHLKQLSESFADSKPVTTEAKNVEFFGCYKSIGGKKIYRVKSVAKSIDSSETTFVDAVFRKDSLLSLGSEEMVSSFLVNGDFCFNKSNGNKCLGSIYSTNVPGVVATGNISTSDFKDRNSYFALAEKNKSIDGKTAWSYVFGISFEDAKLMAKNNPKNPFYYASVNISGGEVLGSREKPVIVILGDKTNGKCSEIVGNSIIYGIVYVRPECVDDFNGVGNSTIYGSIVADGSINKITGSSSINQFDSGGWNYLVGLDKDSMGFLIPGTWKDFD